MDPLKGSAELNQRLASISTMWTVLREAHGEIPLQANRAQQVLLERYGNAIYRYILSAIRDPHIADDLTQEFAFRLVKGDFKNVDPSRGQFRKYLKTVLFRMVSEHRKNKAKEPRGQLFESQAIEVANADQPQTDQQWIESWRDELLARAWESLLANNAVFYAVLKLKSENPKMGSAEMSERLTAQIMKPMSADNVRQNLRRARDQFAAYLIDGVAESLDDPSVDAVESELIDLQLLAYCRK